MRDCGCVSIYSRTSPFPKILLPDSIKKWQCSYFYVKNLTGVDRIGLPAFCDATPSGKSWNQKTFGDPKLEAILTNRVKELVTFGLTSQDLTMAWLSRRMYPLQARSHKMFFYSGRWDPTRASTRALKADTLCQWAALILTNKIGPNWRFGLEPYTRSDRAPVVSRLALLVFSIFLLGPA